MTPPADRMSFDSNVAVTIGVLEPSTRNHAQGGGSEIRFDKFEVRFRYGLFVIASLIPSWDDLLTSWSTPACAPITPPA